MPHEQKEEEELRNGNPGRPSDVQIVMPSKALKAVARLLEEIDDEAHDAARRSFPDG